jgi:ADP-dependent phosphofructokinase/glucokinase|tara:strand:- start:699 stop:938 length:240 start_codon:yes stop_codon:yes gene_type:complete
MKKKALQTLGRVVKSVALGVADNVPVVNSIKANIESELGGKGKYDYIRLASAVATIGVIAAFLMGKLSIEEVERLLDLI